MELRPYQQETVAESINFWLPNNLNAGLCVLPTASGKTVVFAEFIRQALLIKPMPHYPPVFYAISVHQAEIFTEVLNTFWFNFPLTTTKTEKTLRKQWLNGFEVGEKNGLINVATLTTD